MKMKKLALLAPVAMAAAVLAAPASATVDLELGLAIDGSGSLTSAQFNLQKQAYVNVLQSLIPTNGSVAIGVKLFSSNVQNIFTTRVIAGTSDLTDLINAISGMVRPAGNTNISGAIRDFTDEIRDNAIVSNRQLIDVSTDGQNNIGNLNTARAYALDNGIDAINCIGVGSGQRCDQVQAGANAFSLSASNFDDFEAALRKKITIEVHGGAVPEPATWAMMIGGFALIGASMRRRRTMVSFA